MKDDSFRDFILDQLSGLGGLRCLAMFGGYGLYQEETFFGILYKDRLYFKTSEETRAEYIKRGMEPFQPNERQTLKSYYEVPAEVVEDRDQLAAWARQAITGKSSSA